MAKYRVYYKTGASTYVDVEAEDRDDAMDQADAKFDPPQLCAHCSGWGGSAPGVDLGEWEPDEAEDGIVEVSA